MVSLKILVEKEHNTYLLRDMKNFRIYSLKFQFIGINKPEAGDVIVLDSKLVNKLSEYFAQPYVFKLYDEKDGKVTDERDLIGLYSNNKKLILRRIYG